MLTWDEVKVMHQRGVSFGSHTVTHPILSKISADEAKKEIDESKRIIEEKLRIPIRSFAYPNGRKEDFSEATKILLREAGYSCALTTIFGANESDQDLLELRRATPWERDIRAFRIKLNYYKFCS
jgi:peptidoglycan/xylan/chitin deacetylase (PgdA/CDA1 family)